MNILVISPKFHPIIGGGETFVLNSLEQLHAAGHTVAVATEPHPERNLAAYEYVVYEIPGLSDTKLDVVQASDNLYDLIHTVKPDVIHAHGYFALLALGLCNTKEPVIASIHSTPVWGERIIGGMSGFEQEKMFAEQILRMSKPRLVTGANAVYTQSAQRLVSKETKIAYFPYPILPAFFEVHAKEKYRAIYKLRESDVLFTVPSRIIERKGIREAIGALNLLPPHYYLCLPSARKPLDKSYWQSIISSQEFQKVKRRVIIPGYEILHDEMPLLYAASDVVVMPSYYEGAPVATVEAMAAGRPFVGADAQGINSFITHMKNGLLVPKKSIRELADAIVLIHEEKSLQERLTNKARQDVSELSWKIQLPRLLKLYKEVCST